MIRKLLRVIGVFALILIFLIFLFWVVRSILPSEVDDVSPDIACPVGILEKSDVLWVIPKFNGYSISNNLDWCNHILSLNKTIGMHGVVHTYREFEGNITQEYLQEGIDIFEECFGFSPERFKPPQLKISEENIKFVEDNGMSVKTRFNQVTRKVYHCDDEPEIFSNFLIGLI